MENFVFKTDLHFDTMPSVDEMFRAGANRLTLVACGCCTVGVSVLGGGVTALVMLANSDLSSGSKVGLAAAVGATLLGGLYCTALGFGTGRSAIQTRAFLQGFENTDHS